MKKLTVLLAVFSLILSLAACGGGADPAKGGDAAAQPALTENPAATEAPAAETPAAAEETEAVEGPEDGETPEDGGDSGEDATPAEETIEIASAEELAAVNENLSGHYVLTADIDLADAEWTPLGSFVPSGESGEEQELPSPEYAFTGTLDGQGHSIRNLRIQQPESWALGLFGCIANAEVGNFTLEDASVEGAMMAAGAVGYAYCSTVSGVTLLNGSVTGHYMDFAAEGMYGGIVGAGMGSRIENCSAQAEIRLPDGTANAGIVGGGLEMTSVVGCTAAGAVIAGNGCYGIGGVSGCGFAAEEFSDCAAEAIDLTVGDGCFWIGGITGYAGGYADAAYGMPVTVFRNCTVRNVALSAGENPTGVGNIVGSGFYSEEAAASMGAPFDQPTRFELLDCSAENALVPETGVFPELAGEEGITYINLFGVIVSDTYRQLWLDNCATVVGEELAPAVVDALQGSVTSELYGAEAAAAFAEGDGMVFDCWYINGAESFTFRDDTVTIRKTDGSSETHTYAYLGQYLIGEGESMTYQGQEMPVAFPCDVYRSTDEAGEFNYFFLRDDTMESTWHIEFRYGAALRDLQGYFEGPYAYWLAAGIDEAADEQTIENVIGLFCLENMDYSAHSEAALNQLAELGFIGTWTADLSAFGEAYADTELYFTLDEAGHGATFMNGQQTRDFEAYAVDNGEKGDGAGLYVAYDNAAFEPESAAYTLETDGDGNTVLTFYAADGVISYLKTA